MTHYRLPTRHDPLTVDEQEDLDRQLGKMFDENLPSYHMLACQLDNVGRLHATLQFYRNLLEVLGRDPKRLDAALPERLVRNGITYLYFTEPNGEEARRCTWKPEDDER